MIDQAVMEAAHFEEEAAQADAREPGAQGQKKVPIAQSTPSTREAQRKRALALAIEVARLLDENKCTDVMVLNVHGLTQVQDYIVIASGTSERQMRTCTGDIKALVDLHEQSVYRADKDTTGTWQVIDCVDVVVHLFEPNTRGYYDLESRWGDAPRVVWERDGQKKVAADLAESTDGIEDAETFGEAGDEVAVKPKTQKPARKTAGAGTKAGKKMTKKPAKVAKKVAKKAAKKAAKKVGKKGTAASSGKAAASKSAGQKQVSAKATAKVSKKVAKKTTGKARSSAAVKKGKTGKVSKGSSSSKGKR